MKFARKLPDPGAVAIAPLEADPTYKEILSGITALEARMAEAERRRAAARAMLRAQRPEVITSDALRPVRNVLDQAAALLKGGRVSASDPGREALAADEEVRICQQALDHERARLHERCAEMSIELAEKFKPTNRAALRAAVAAMEDLHDALQVAREANARIEAAGYHPPSWLLPMAAPEPALMLGDPNLMSSESNRFKRFVENLS